jgi:hypothetical protein
MAFLEPLLAAGEAAGGAEAAAGAEGAVTAGEEATAAGQAKNLSPMQFAQHMGGGGRRQEEGGGYQGHAQDFDSPGYVS